MTRLYLPLSFLTLVIAPACDQGADPFAAVRPDADPGDASPLSPEVSPPEGVRDFSGLVINEVDPNGAPDDWFELYNGSGRDLELAGLGFSDDPGVVKATLPVGTMLAAGRHLVVLVSDTRVGFKLAREESLALFTPDGELLDETAWALVDEAPGRTWGRWPDGRGDFQVVVASPAGVNTRPEPEPEPEPEPCGNGALDGGEVCDGELLRDMTCGDFGFDGGTLACDGLCARFDTSGCTLTPRPDVVINEVTSSGDDLVELLNRGPVAADLAGWALTDQGYLPGDTTTEDHRWVFPAGARLAPGERRVLRKGSDFAFGLGAEDGLILWDGSGAVVDDTAWTQGQAAVSWCRLPDGEGPFAPCVAATLGQPNTATAPTAPEVLLGELYFDEPGADGASVFTELWGPPGASLEGFVLVGVNGSDGAVYRTVPLAGTIPADGFFVVATADARDDTLAARDLTGHVDWQNGPDAVRLVDPTGKIVDALQYGTRPGFSAGLGTPAAAPPSGKSLQRKSRTPSVDNANDFVIADPTPGR